MLKKVATGLALTVLAAPFAGQAQEGAGPSAPTPEAAAKFIDSVLGNGVAKVAFLREVNSGVGHQVPEVVRTVGCETVIQYKKESFGRTTLKIDWRAYVASNSYFVPPVTDRWAARALARTESSLLNSDGTFNPLAFEQGVGVMIEPGTEELKDRLIRAVDFYGKSCAPKMDGPF